MGMGKKSDREKKILGEMGIYLCSKFWAGCQIRDGRGDFEGNCNRQKSVVE